MKALVNMRREGPNQLMTRKLVLSLSSEAKSDLNVVGRLKILGFLKLAAEYDRVVREQYNYTITALVRFETEEWVRSTSAGAMLPREIAVRLHQVRLAVPILPLGRAMRPSNRTPVHENNPDIDATGAVLPANQTAMQ